MIQEVITQIESDLHNGKVVFLVGAGISIDPPTCFPSAIPLSNAILEALCKQKSPLFERIFGGENYPKAFIEPFRAVRQRLFSAAEEEPKEALRLEVIIDELYHVFGVQGLNCLGFMKDARPNWYHNILAEFNIVGCNILTTNFDAAIESACKHIGRQPAVLAAEEDYSTADFRKAPQGLIIKIHGDINGEPENLGATLTSLDQGLTVPKKSCLDALLNDCHLIVVGYSASDHFDLSPFLVRKRFRRITWLQYRKDHDYRITKLQNGKVIVGCPKCVDNITVSATLLKNAETCWWIEGSTAKCCGKIHDAFFSSKESDNENCPDRQVWREFISSWGNQLNSSLAAYVVGRLSQQIGLASLAAEAYTLARTDLCFDRLSPTLRAMMELQEEYLLSLTGRYGEREKYLVHFKHRWANQKVDLKEEWGYLKLLIAKKIASCKTFDDRLLTAFYHLIFGICWGWLYGFYVCKKKNPFVWQKIVSEIFESNTEFFFIIRIYVRRWFFSLPGWVLGLLLGSESIPQFLIHWLFPFKKGGLINRIRADQYRGKNEVEKMFSSPHLYLEVENLLGLTNTLRERALRIIADGGKGEQKTIVLRNAQKLLRQSIFVSSQIDDYPGVAKGYHHLAWTAYQRGMKNRYAVLCREARKRLALIDAPRWRALRIKQLENWGRLLFY